MSLLVEFAAYEVTPLDRVIGREVGADNYIANPFHLREALASVKGLLRRRKAQTPDAFRAYPNAMSAASASSSA